MKNNIVKAMGAKLDGTWIKKLSIPGRPELSYVPIDKTIKFLNDTFGDNWSITLEKIEWLPTSVPAVSIIVALSIWEDGAQDSPATRLGVGSDIHKPGRSGKAQLDTDKLIKTAYASAVKKATNMFGFALELWDESNVTDDFHAGNYTPPPVQQPPMQQPPMQQPPVAPPPVQQPPVQQQPPVPQAPPQVPPQVSPEQQVPKTLSPESKAKVGEFCQQSGLAKADLEDFLKEFNPNSNGNPASLCFGDEAQNLEKFLQFVKGKLQK